MCCSTARRVSARRRSPGFSRARWASASAPRPGPVIAKSGDLAALLTNLEDGDVLFIDEIHRLNPAVEEVLYPAMEDRALDLMIGEGPSARSVRIDLPRFTLIGATTRQGLLTTPLRDRFGIPVRLNFYTVEELEQVVRRAARLLGVDLTEDGAREIARRSRGTPRIAGRLLRRVRDFAHASGSDTIDAKVADRALSRLEIDALGLDAMDRRYLTMIADLYGGGPVGVETLAAGLSEPRDTIEDVIEPYLIQLGLIARTARGRCLNGRGYAHLGLAGSRRAARPACSIRERLRSNASFMFIARCRLLVGGRSRFRAASSRVQPRRDYSKDTNWLCLPGRADICSTPLADDGAQLRTAMARSAQSSVAKDPPIDCFYVYPTVSSDHGMNSDLNVAARRRLAAAGAVRALRLRVPDLRADLSPDDARRGRRLFGRRRHRCRPAMLAYATSLAAWRNYLATQQQGPPVRAHRPQPGQPDAAELIAREIENNPAVASRMKLAIIPGFNVLVPAGKAGRRHVQEDAAVQSPGRDRLRHDLDQLSREERAARGRDLRLLRTSRE